MLRFSPIALVLLLIFGLFAAGCDSDDGDPIDPGNDINPDPAPTDPNYVPPADRFDPAATVEFEAADFVALGEARSGVDGEGAAPSTAQSRYVSALSGDNDNSGEIDAPWRSLQHAADTATPGTTIYVDSSADYAGGLSISHSGTKDQWIVFRNRDAGSAPRIVGGGDYDAVVDIDASYVVFMGFEIADHVRPGMDSDEIGIRIEPREGDISNLRILNNWIHGIGPPDAAGASCHYNAHGIIAQSENMRIDELIIDGNEMHDLYVGNSECLVINGNIADFRVTNNYIHDVNNIAIDIIGYEKNEFETARRGLVADNVVLDASNYWPYCSRGNCTYPAGDESSDGIYVDGGAEIVIEYNAVGRTDHGIELQSENGQLIRNVEVRYNAVFNSNYKNFTLGPSQDSFEHDNAFFDEPALADPQLEGCK